MTTVPRKVKAKIHDPDASITETWGKLSNAIREIHNHNASNLSFEENYRYAYNLVLHKYGKQMYDGVAKLIMENIDKLAETVVKPTFPSSVNGDPAQKSQEVERFLKAVRDSWDDHLSSMSKVKGILKYMDHVYCPSAGVPVIWDCGMNLFLSRMIQSPIKEHIINAILNQIQIDREGYAINRSAMKSCVDILLALRYETGTSRVTVYKRDVEPAVLRDSEAFYKAEGERLLTTCDSAEYLRRVEDRFTQEDARAMHYLSSQTATPLRQILEDTLLSPHLPTIIQKPNSGLDSMIDLDQKDNLARLYRLFDMVSAGRITLRRALKDSILRRGTEINQTYGDGMAQDTTIVVVDDPKGKGKARNTTGQNIDTASKWVEDVLSLKDRFDQFWRYCFNSDREFETSCNEAFETFINRNKLSSEYISLFIDENLKKGLKGKTDQEVDIVLDKTITVFRYITDKDVFERYYKMHLAKRLLHNRSVSDDAERGMLAKLKIECGFHFTQKLEGMFTDMKVSADTMEAYKKHIAKTTPPEIEMSVTVMTSNAWPNNLTQKPPPCNLPECMRTSASSFENFYLSRHSGRKVTWQLTLGTVDVKVAFKNRKHDLNVSTLAMVILLLFEDLQDGQFLTYEEIKKATDLPEPDLKRHLQSLACAKFKVLKKHPPSRDVNPDDSFSFNSDFSASMQRIKISTVSAAAKVEDPEERKETMDRIDQERGHQIDACIVRIMKNRRHMTHTDLINEVTRQLASRFAPQPLGIKKRIENLIDRDYLERCEDKKSYNYLA
ncbi:ubiquitin ligase SCF complex subunit Cullin [Fomitiporia mediterranea MF3/22]|uniref:ubiquitin ligase SCF complex subunit Cullin n=1 Tax=Fomitiporia mediterranea (strain MF3/22) TaxID=694068 RepID=UPI0004407CFD|nr:ubiquitin ligase SCF complex subunit Cullin [Fomitiporia mediterranea MF3/22]EJD06564.1 ubiquitin ligase SCF complex subunit Cullin [Fomitiporia mediterranea MF3/22]